MSEDGIPSFWVFFIPCFLVLMLFLVMGERTQRKLEKNVNLKEVNILSQEVNQLFVTKDYYHE